jgi:uncharacterized membrane protein
MSNFLELLKNYLIGLAMILFIGLVLYGTIVIGLIVLTAGLIIGVIASAIIYWKLHKNITRYKRYDAKTGETLYYYEAKSPEEDKKAQP